MDGQEAEGPVVIYDDDNYYMGAVLALKLRAEGRDVVLATNTIPYQTAAGGRYYLPTNAPYAALLNDGSTNAHLLSLYHYTTTTNQVKETNTIVDLGFHYVAVDGSGLPVDSDGDGVPDYLEDKNGNGQVDGGETDWTDPDSFYGGGSGPGLEVFTPLRP